MNTRETVDSPNFSIIMPGPCQGKCAFCFWEREQALPAKGYLTRLKETLGNLPGQFWKCSITGGEPTMSPVLFEVLKMVRKRFAKVVFTTNGGPVKGGLNLISRHEIGDRVAQFIDFLNISRHHFDDRKNSAIFGTKMMPIINIPAAINRFNKAGVPVTANCVLGHPSSMDIYDYMFRMRSAGFSSICFRKPHVEGCDLLPTQQESMFRDYKVIEHSECPVCRSDTQLIRGMNVIWTASIPEPMDGMDGVVYEAVFHPDGKLTADWSKNIEIEL